MEGRVESGFRRLLRALPSASDPDGREREIEQVLAGARAQAGRDEPRLARLLAHAYEAARDRMPVAASSVRAFAEGEAPAFLCDQSLGGLARWLHAAGYQAALAPEVPGHRLPEHAAQLGLVLVTTDTEVLDRRLVAGGSLRVVWLPSALTTREKLGLVLRELGLAPREPLCMACGGHLEARAKEAVAARIPPRTARWKDEYFVCSACDRLYWQGTHWERIVPALRAAMVAS